MSAKKRHVTEAAAIEMERWGDRSIVLDMHITQALTFCGALQLALRHPGFCKQPSAEEVRKIVFQIAQQISMEDFPAIHDLIKFGFHPRFDS
jgi:hypothetical protein